MQKYELPAELRDALVVELSRFSDNSEPVEIATALYKPDANMLEDPYNIRARDGESQGFLGVKVRFRRREKS